MVKVLVLGATGFIGGPVAHAFAARGYTVYGLTRSKDKAKQLQQNEITPIIGEAQNAEAWRKCAEECSIIIEAISDYQDYSTPGKVQQVLIDILKRDKSKIVIYTSGVWCYGDTGNNVVDEASPLNPPTLVKSRPDMEKSYTSNGGIVIRPSLVYGKSGSISAMWFKAFTSGDPKFPGVATRVSPFVHTEDLAVAYVLAAQKADLIRGQCFNITSQNEPFADVISQISKAAGFKGEAKFFPPSDPFSECLALSQRFSNQKARTVLGWNPTHQSFCDGADRYYNAWKAFN